MQQPLPKTPAEWLHEIVCAMADAQKFKPAHDSGRQKGIEHSTCNLAAVACLKFRGRRSRGNEIIGVLLDVIEAYLENTDPDRNGLQGSPFRSFAFCYLAAHRSLGLLDGPQADAIFKFCDENLGDD